MDILRKFKRKGEKKQLIFVPCLSVPPSQYFASVDNSDLGKNTISCFFLFSPLQRFYRLNPCQRIECMLCPSVCVGCGHCAYMNS